MRINHRSNYIYIYICIYIYIYIYTHAYKSDLQQYTHLDEVLVTYKSYMYIQTHVCMYIQQGQWDPPDLRGIIPRAFCRIFEKIDQTHDQNFLVRVNIHIYIYVYDIYIYILESDMH
jgi:hypothetical protein